MPMHANRKTRPPLVRSGTITYDEFAAIIREDQKADLIDGVIYMASPEGTEANDLYMWLGSLMEFFVNETKVGEVFGSRVAFQLSETNAPEPDLAFVHQDHADRIQKGRVVGPPDLAVEIITPDSVRRDYEAKYNLYEQRGVTEYWIIDEHKQKVSAYRLNRAGTYRTVRLRKGELRSEAMTGFWLRPEWLWQPRPRLLECIQAVLSKSTGA
jgi:Uma2 family endonuclease